MIKQLLLSASLTSTLLMTGCMSTGPDLPEPVEFNSEREYQWEEDKSFALNIAQMGKFAGVGIGNEDSDEPMTAGNNIPGTGSTVLNSVAGFATGGLLGAFSMGGLSGDDQKAHMWPTSFMSFIPVNELEGKDEQTVRKIVQTHSSSLIKDALIATFPDTNVYGDYASKSNGIDNYGNTIITLKNDSCLTAYNTGRPALETALPVRKDFGKYFNFDSKMDGISNYCFVTFSDIISGTITVNGKANYIVVTKAGINGETAFFFDSIKNNFKGAVLVSQLFKTFPRGKLLMANPNSHVLYKGRDYYFDASETSSKDQL